MTEFADALLEKQSVEAVCQVSLKPETVRSVQEQSAAEAELFTAARSAGFRAANHSSLIVAEMVPARIEQIAIRFRWQADDRGLDITVQVFGYSRAGLETEALSGAAAAGLAVFHQLRKLDSSIQLRALQITGKPDGLEKTRRV